MSIHDFAYLVILPILAAALLLAFIRAVRGPSIANRVAALDLMSSITIGIILVSAVASGIAVVIDVAIALALIAFLGTVAFAYYIGRRK